MLDFFDIKKQFFKLTLLLNTSRVQNISDRRQKLQQMQSLLGVILAIDETNLFCSPLGEWCKHVLLKISILYKVMKMLFVQLVQKNIEKGYYLRYYMCMKFCQSVKSLIVLDLTCCSIVKYFVKPNVVEHWQHTIYTNCLL